MPKTPKPQLARKPAPREHPGPWGSVLWDHLDEIRALRRKRKRWEDIALHLEKERGVKLTSRSIRNFFARAVKAKLPLGFEPIAPSTSPTVEQPASAPAPPKPVATDQPDYEPVENPDDSLPPIFRRKLEELKKRKPKQP